MPQPFVPFPGSVDVTLNMTWRTIPVANKLMFQFDAGVPSTGDLISLGSMLRAWYDGGIHQLQTTELTLDNIRLVKLDLQNSEGFTYTAGLPDTGPNPEQSVSNHTALCVSFGTAARGRSARGRNYVPGLRSTDYVDNFWNSTPANAIAQSYADLIDLAVDIGYVWGVGSRKSNGVWRTLGLFQPITSVTLKTLRGATMRERMQ